jgi:hypothetical protein
MYNLGDIIRFNFKRGLDFEESSIAFQYLKKTKNPLTDDIYQTPPSVDFQLLYEIVNKRERQPLEDSTFVIHARTGDWLHLAPPQQAFIDVIHKYNLNKRFKKCGIVYAKQPWRVCLSGYGENAHNKDVKDALGHTPEENLSKSEEYILKLKTEIENLNLSCDLISGSVDDDFTLLATSKCYVVGCRGFGWLAASINPNEVIWDIQEPPLFAWDPYKTQLREGYENQQKLSNGQKES